MSDVQRPEPDDAGNPPAGGEPDWRSAQTGRFDAFRDDATGPMPAGGGGDATGPMPAADGGDATRPMPAPGDATRPMSAAGDGPRPMGVPGADQTRQIPPVDDAWSGRAQVRGPRPAMESTTVGTYPAVDEPEPQRKWWLPILLGVLAVLVVAALILAGWLITRSSGTEDPAPVAPSAPAPSVAPSSASPSPRRSPSPSPSSAAPEETVRVPPLVGLNQGDAVRALDDMGLGYEVTLVAGEGPLGTVISSNPKEGAEVKPGTQVGLVVVDRPASPSASPSPTEQPAAED